MAERPSAALAYLADMAKSLGASLVAYQQALLAARAAGATHTQIAEVLGTSESGARWRCKAAAEGGEIHLQLPKEERS